MSEINTQKLEYTGATAPANTTKVAEAAFSGAHAGAASRAPAVVIVDANLDDAVGAPATTASQPTGGAGLLGWLSGIYTRTGEIVTALTNNLGIRALSGATDSVAVSNFPASQPVSAQALPLPEGASTAVLQAAGNAVLAALDEKIPDRVSSGLPVTVNAFTFGQSTVNTTTGQLAAGATFSGVAESAFNQQGIQVMGNADQPYTIAVIQYQDAGGTKMLSTSSFVRLANEPTNETVQVNGNFVKVTITNNGAVATTTLYLDTTYGPLPPLPLSLTNYGNQRMAVKEVDVDTPTYGFLTAPFTPAATPSDFFVIQGPPANSNKVIEILDLSVGGAATAATLVDFFVVKRSTLNTGGTTVATTIVPYDSGNPAPVATMRHYAANPTALGTTVGTVCRMKGLLTIATTAQANPVTNLLHNKTSGAVEQLITLRGPNECLCVNFASTALPAGSANWFVQGVIRERTI